jgi:hypothetical protein
MTSLALGLAAVAALVALHLRDRRRRVVPVSALLLWRRLPPARLEPRRLRSDPLFLLQLGLVLALVGAHAGPTLRGTPAPAPPAVVLVLDVSASMQAREADGRTRFELVRRRALALVAGEGTTMIVAAALRPRIVLRWTRDPVLVRQRLETLAPLDLPTALAPGVALALAEAGAHGARVAVLTDLAPASSDVPPAERAAVDWIQVGRTDDNLALASLTVDAPAFGGLAAARATAVVQNHDDVPRHPRLEAAVDGEAWARRDVDLPPHGAAAVVFERPPASGVLAVALADGDALAADDVARAWIPASAPLDLVAVTDDADLAAALAALVKALPRGRVAIVSGANVDAVVPAAGQVAVFDRVAPREEPAGAAALYVAPPAGNAVCPGVGTVEAARVVDWEADHPALAGLDGLDALEVPRAVRLAAAAWATPLVLALAPPDTFPLLLAGERGGRRVACLAVPLEAPLASSDRLPLLLLVLDTLRWLAEPPGALVLETGVPARLGGEGAGPVPGLRVAGDPAVVMAERAGSYRLGPHPVIANLFDDRESDIGRDGGGEWPGTAPRLVVSASAGHDLRLWLLGVTALLLAAEWVVWLRRRA